jgi:hypothetical protein
LAGTAAKGRRAEAKGEIAFRQTKTGLCSPGGRQTKKPGFAARLENNIEALGTRIRGDT